MSDQGSKPDGTSCQVCQALRVLKLAAPGSTDGDRMTVGCGDDNGIETAKASTRLSNTASIDLFTNAAHLPVIYGKTGEQLMISFVDASRLFFQRAFDFEGRSSRAEYWWAYLMGILLYLGGSIVLGVLGQLGAIIFFLILLGMIIPGLAVVIRRLHDTDRSGWWILIGVVPLVGFIVMLVFMCTPGTKGPNKFGQDPYGGFDANVFN